MPPSLPDRARPLSLRPQDPFGDLARDAPTTGARGHPVRVALRMIGAIRHGDGKTGGSEQRLVEYVVTDVGNGLELEATAAAEAPDRREPITGPLQHSRDPEMSRIGGRRLRVPSGERHDWNARADQEPDPGPITRVKHPRFPSPRIEHDTAVGQDPVHVEHHDPNRARSELDLARR